MRCLWDESSTKQRLLFQGHAVGFLCFISLKNELVVAHHSDSPDSLMHHRPQVEMTSPNSTQFRCWVSLSFVGDGYSAGEKVGMWGPELSCGQEGLPL